MVSSRSIGVFTYTVTRGAGGTDSILNPCGSAAVASLTVSQGDNVFVSPGDYTFTAGDTTITIDWSRGGNEPAAGTQYTVKVTCANATTPVIAGVAKIVAPVASAAGRTSAQHEAVSGYTALTGADVAGRLVFPIVQTNNGWDSVLHITNFDTKNNCSVTVTLYQTPSGYSDPSFGSFTKLLNKGQTWHLDLKENGVPDGWVGQAWVSSDCAVAATVDRVKAAQPWGTPVNMALTNQALAQDSGNTVQVLPFIFQGFNGWNSGFSLANLSETHAASVQITYYNSAGNAVGTESRVIQPRAMEVVYKPYTTDVGIGGFGHALVTSSQPVLVAVDSVKYTGNDQDVGQALGYVAQRGVREPGRLFMPLFQKQGLLSGGNDNSGVALFNTGDDPARVEIRLYDSSGALVAPTLTAPVETTIPSFGGYIFYAPAYDEMPGGFQGSVVVDVTGNAGRDVYVVGVSNNVNYDVQFDGSAAYNMPIEQREAPPAPTYNLAVDPPSAVNACESTGADQWDCPFHTITATLTFGGEPVEDVNILFEILDGSLHDDAADTDGGDVNPTFQLAGDDDFVLATDASGQAELTIEGTEPGDDNVLVCADLNDNGVCDKATEPYAVATKDWVGLTLAQTFPADNGAAPETGVGNTIRDWTVAVNRTGAASVPVVLVLDEATTNPVNASFAPCNLPDQNSIATTVSAATTSFDVYACDYTDDGTGDTVDVDLYWDVNGNGVVDAGEPLIDTITLTLADGS